MMITNYGDATVRPLQVGDGGTMDLREGDFIADRELLLTKDGRVVEARDKDANELLIAKGQIIRREVAAKHGLRLEDGKVAWGAVAARPEAEPAPAADEDPSDADDLGALTNAQLRDLAAEHGVEVPDRATKAELVAALKGE